MHPSALHAAQGGRHDIKISLSRFHFLVFLLSGWLLIFDFCVALAGGVL